MADQYKVSTAIVTESERRSFVVKVHGYSRLKGLLKIGECVPSSPFSVEGHNWFLRYYPNGLWELRAAYVYLLLNSVDGKYVTAEAARIHVLGEYGTPTR
jgi:speckle-type POZ protein